MICPSCGRLGGNKEELFAKGMKKICKEMSIDDDAISLGYYEEDEKFHQKEKALMDGIIHKNSICCAARLPNTIDLSDLIRY